jgi:hypothetical protein
MLKNQDFIEKPFDKATYILYNYTHDSTGSYGQTESAWLGVG